MCIFKLTIKTYMYFLLQKYLVLLGDILGKTHVYLNTSIKITLQLLLIVTLNNS